ncbi:SusD-like protein P2 [subsurface metagenome]
MKTKRYISVTIIILTVFSLAQYSCEDYLDVPEEGKIPEGYIQEVSADDAFKFVSACYAGLRKFGISVFAYMGMFEITSDDALKGSTPEDNPAQKAMDEFTYTPNNEHIELFWNDHYAVIGNCNYAVNQISSLPMRITTAQNALVAEARFLRAYLYFKLNLVFGGVPLVDTTLAAEEFAKISRSTVEQTYDFIEEDLEFAADHLPLSYSFDEAGRATSGAAKTLLARVHMFQNEWAWVQQLTDEVIQSGIYLLYPNFYNMFRVAGENTSGSIFELQCTSIDQGKYKCEYGFVQGPRNNFAKLQGWGFKIPSPDLISFFDSRNDSVRKAATVLYRGSSTPEGDSIDVKCPNEVYNHKVYTQIKYNTVDYALDHNIRFIRFADVLLMSAEAAIHVGGDVSGPLNEVRDRVDLDPIASPGLQDVWDERRAEFALEEHRFFDLIRTGRAGAVLGPLGFVTGKHEVFPLPQNQMDLSNGVLTQNPGY